MEELQKFSYWDIIKGLKKLLHPYRGRFWLGSFLRLTSDLAGLYGYYALTKLISFFSDYSVGKSLDEFWFFFVLWNLSFIYSNVSRQGAKYLCNRIAERVKLDSKLSALKHLSLIDIAWHEKENTGNKLKRVENGGDGWDKLIKIWVATLIPVMVNIVGMIFVLSRTDLRVGLIMLAFLVTYLCVSVPLGRRASKAARLVNQHEEDFSGLAFESLNNIRTVKVMNIFPYLFPRLKKQAAEISKAVTRRVWCFRSKSAAQSSWSQIFRAGAMFLIGYGIIEGRYGIAFLVLFNFYFSILRESVEELSEVSQEFVIARHHLSRLNDILLEPVRIDSDKNKKSFPANWKTISFHNVSFAYGENQVLKNISFDIHRGEKIGIVGLSGAGKSTIFKLLLKEYENYTGEILIDKIALRKIKRSSYFDHVAIVAQETEVFNFSLKDNVTISGDTEHFDQKKLQRTFEIAHMTDFMNKLPEGINTLIGEKGVKLSGGEKQRVGIARAVFKEPDILFLDEATSHLDLESEEKIKDSLHQFFKNVTALVIAHRLSTIQEMDRILLFEGGELLEEGNFQALYKKKGRFFELWEKQNL
ncbi:MAG: hypothetical protein A3B90_03170 [Candidatus Magasanikbacteria bacterium RIFCSPHIGHO2_02_FULL_41_13]|uniref:ABC transporter domain-containing protein n=1 Tax=Candidatus Magasanikbacteria bacterium RIFCSPHIGHO2_02_FULL_41_13 TaxID=1798676 RepID=A0A1F6M2N2_9BACT|nr:MAG: hypothetical protein A3B90_03170 [Candidatus Magasanikbacteria bacterium RIFCSPHIGHO2_02_FULL_41_13]